jgi:hypothetical protein
MSEIKVIFADLTVNNERVLAVMLELHVGQNTESALAFLQALAAGVEFFRGPTLIWAWRNSMGGVLYGGARSDIVELVAGTRPAQIRWSEQTFPPRK